MNRQISRIAGPVLNPALDYCRLYFRAVNALLEGKSAHAKDITDSYIT